MSFTAKYLEWRGTSLWLAGLPFPRGIEGVFVCRGSWGLMADQCQILNSLAYRAHLPPWALCPRQALNTDKWITEKMEHQHVRGTGTQIHCSGAAVTAPSNYIQWRLIPAFRRGMKKESTLFSLSVPTTSIMSENMCQHRGNPAHLLTKKKKKTHRAA